MTPLLAEEGARVLHDVEVLTGPLPGGDLVAAYQAGAAALAPFYSGHPGDPGAYQRKAAEVEGRLDAAARQRLAPAIEPLGDARERLERILGGDGFFVTTGQQPALFGGPLYTLYKILGAIRLAAALEPLLGRPVLALFWSGADDHDWDEANHAALLDDELYVQRVQVRAPHDAPPLPLFQRQWGADVGRANEELRTLLGEAPHAAAVLAHVRGAYTPGAAVAASFEATLRLLLRDRRLALISSAAPELRRAAVPVLRREAANADAHHRLLAEQTSRLEAAGFPAQVALAGDASNLMLIDAHGRDRLMRTERGWQTRRQRQALAGDVLLQQIETEPDRFSPNVLLRPVVESATLPTVAYVAGPGELRYFGQIGCLFEAHGIMPPVVVPRPSVTLVDARSRRLLERLRLDPADVRRPYPDLVRSVIRRELPERAEAALERIRQSIHDGYAELMNAVEAIDPTLRGPLTGARNRSLMRANDAEKRILRHLKRRNEVLLEQLRRLAASLQPNGAPQERVLAVLPTVARYGPGLVARIEDALDMEPRPVARWDGLRCG